MAIGVTIAIVVVARLQVFRQAAAERLRRFASVVARVKANWDVVAPRQFLVIRDEVVEVQRAVAAETFVVGAV